MFDWTTQYKIILEKKKALVKKKCSNSHVNASNLTLMHTILWILCAYWQLPETNYFNKDITAAPDHAWSVWSTLALLRAPISKEIKLFHNKRENKTLGPSSCFTIKLNNNIISKARAQYLVKNTLKMEAAALHRSNGYLGWRRAE